MGALGSVIPKVIQIKVEKYAEIKILFQRKEASESDQTLQSVFFGDIAKVQAVFQLSVRKLLYLQV